MKLRDLLMIAALAMPSIASADMVNAPLWLRDVKISPDGRQIVFQYGGDLWLVPSQGGTATRLTTADTYEASPVWSPDSRTIAYASDAYGSFDVFAIEADGTGERRLTFNSASEIPEAFTPDGRCVMFSAAIQDPVESAVFPTARMTELYEVPVYGEPTSPRQVLATPARFVSWAKDGKSFLYQDVKGHEDEWRKHHTSSVTRDVWRYDVRSGKHTNLTERGGEDLNPVAGTDGSIYFLSERNGLPINVYRAPGGDMSKAEAVTTFATHPVRFLSQSADGTLAMTYDGEIYTLVPGEATPKKVSISLNAPRRDDRRKLQVRSGATHPRVSPDGKSVAFIYRGDVFVTSVDYTTTKQITSTAQAEGDVEWMPDSRSLVFTSEAHGPYNIYKASIERDDKEYDFPNATLIKIEPLFDSDGTERTRPKMSPDGKKLAFIANRNQLMVMDMATKEVRQLTDGSVNPLQGNGFEYQWSPNSKFIALEVIDRKHYPYSDIAIIDVPTGKLVNLTQSGYFDEDPHWALDGNAIVFLSERYGMRNHASWGTQYDVMAVFLNQEAYDRFKLTKEGLAIAKEMEKKHKADSTKTSDVRVDLKGIEERTVRLTPMSADIRDALLTDDGETLYYVTPTTDGAQIWKVGLREPSFKLATTRGSLGGFQTTPDGKKVFFLGSQMAKFDPKADKFTAISYSADMNLDPAAEREYMFDYVTREERERFYRTDMHGVDWPAMTAAYRKFLPHINNNYDFAEMLSEMLGELNVSHTGGRYSPTTDSQAERTASLGLIFDLDYKGKGSKVAEVIEGGPFDRSDTKMRPGAIITAIDGTEVTPGDNLTMLLCDRSGKTTLVSFKLDGTTIDETVKPISASRESSLLYDRWTKSRAHYVDSISGGRLAYVHIQSMNDASFRKIYTDLLGRYYDREGVVIDIRWNGGGRLHEDIEVLFSGHEYFMQVLRGTEICEMPSRRWNKPSVMVTSEACYSNAHGTPWVYKHLGLGKVVGMPVPGTMTSVNWQRMQDPTLVFGIPVVGYRLPDGSYLENTQLEPDIRVANNPADIVRGRDAQLDRAVEELLRQIDAK